MTDFGSPTGPVAFGGRGEFDGAMTGAFRAAARRGRRSAARTCARSTRCWGDGTAHIVVENSYVHDQRRRRPARRLGDPRRRPVLARLSARRRRRGDRRAVPRRRAAISIRCATRFRSTTIRSPACCRASSTSRASTTRPVGFGAMTIDDGVAYGEPFQKATASLRFDGAGVRLDGLNIAEGAGAITGAAYVGWDATYSFNADGRRIPVERIAAFCVSAGAAVRPRRVLGRRQRHVRRAALRRAVSASTICSSAKKASARSPARWRCAARS